MSLDSVRCDSKRGARDTPPSQVGSSTALAGLKLEVFVPRDDAPGAGAVQTTVEMTPLCSPDARPGRPSETAQVGVVPPKALALTVLILTGSARLSVKPLCASHGGWQCEQHRLALLQRWHNTPCGILGQPWAYLLWCSSVAAVPHALTCHATGADGAGGPTCGRHSRRQAAVHRRGPRRVAGISGHLRPRRRCRQGLITQEAWQHGSRVVFRQLCE